MHLVFISLFPEFIEQYFSFGVLGRAKKQDILKTSFYNPRDFSDLPHRHVDDHPYGGGSGMVMRADILKKTLEKVCEDLCIDIRNYDRSKHMVVLMSASGDKFNQPTAQALSAMETLIFVSGRYEGIDQRFIDLYVDKSLSIGEYVLSGGEVPSLVCADVICRLIPKVLGNPDSLLEESHTNGYGNEYPHYTRPAVFDGASVPDELMSGNHSFIKKWRNDHKS
jgi:tRNA (guanine37-N1)-methyltransferase